MPAYSKSITYHCARCGGKATREVFNGQNSSMGYYCGDCAKRYVAELNGETGR